MTCFDNCSGRDNAITSGTDSHRPDDPHTLGNAVDLGRGSNPDLSRDTAEGCYNQCFASNGASGFGQEEANLGPGTHFHLQCVPGQGGATNAHFPPGVVPHRR